MATIVNVQDPSSNYYVAVDANGRIGINNWPGVQVISGTVNVSAFPSMQAVSGSVNVTDRFSRVLGNVVVTSGGVGTNTAPAYSVIQDASNNAHKMTVNADGSINISGSITASNPSVDTTGDAVPASATYIGANKSGNLVGLSLDSSGSLNVNIASGGGSGGTSSSYGSSFPSTGTAIGASDGTNMQGLLVESASNKNLRIALYNGTNEASVSAGGAVKVDGSAATQPVSGTVSSAQSGSWTVAATQSGSWSVSIGSALPVGSNTIGNVGVVAGSALIGGVQLVDSGGTNKATISSGGALKVDGSAATQPVSGTFWQATQPISGTVTANAGTNLNTSLLALESGGNLATIAGRTPALGQAVSASSSPVVIASNQSNLPANIKQVGDNNIALGNNALPVLNSAAATYVTPGSNNAALTSDTDYLFVWAASASVNHLMIQNNSSIPIHWDLDAATTAGSPVLSNTAGQNTLFLDVRTTTLHMQGTGTPNVNGSSAGNIVVRGWL